MRKDEFARRRQLLMRMIGKGGIAILPTAPEKTRNSDVHYHFRPSSDFFYLTGFAEPEAMAVLIPGRPQGEYVLFTRKRDRDREIWDGRRAGTGGAVKDFGADDAFPIDDINEILPGLIESRERVYYTMGEDPEFDQRMIGWVNHLKHLARSGTQPRPEFVALDHLLHDMRLFKSRPEMDAMRHSARIAVEAHKRAMRFTRPGRNEFEVMAEILHEFHRNQADISYHPIVGGGANACILHYHENNAELKARELLLIDAGCEYEFYASDITRTFPVDGRFTPEQRAIYEVVLEAQYAAIEKIKPGNHWNEAHDAAVHVITNGLVKLGILKGKTATLIKDGAFRKFYMHKTGHWLGMDVHDVGDYKVGEQWRVLEPGMVMTVEPGIYIPRGSKGVDKRWWNIGVRIEDDVLVRRGGNEVLTEALPKDPDEIEKLMQAA